MSMKKGLLTLLLYCFFSIIVAAAASNVLMIAPNLTQAFGDIEASFAPSVKAPVECGILYVAEPIDACSPLRNKFENKSSPYALIIRGGCTFEDKVRRAQSAGFKAAIVYDNIGDEPLVAMAGSSSGIKIHAAFVSKSSGEILKGYATSAIVELWIIPANGNSAWSIMAISFISLLAMSAVLATCFFVRRHRLRRERPRASRIREFHGMSSRLVKAMPSLTFTSVSEDNSTSRTCAICLEDYTVGEKLRVLPCRHKFHAICVDSWLTTWRTFCPVCKRDARTSTGEPPVSECTPLLSSASLPSVGSLSSIQSSLAASSVMQILPASSRSPSLSHNHSLSITPYVSQSRRSYGNLNASSMNSSVDLRNSSFHRSLASHSLGYPSLSSYNSRYVSPYIPSSSNASPSYVGSSSRQPCVLHCESAEKSQVPMLAKTSMQKHTQSRDSDDHHSQMFLSLFTANKKGGGIPVTYD